ncbi:MAG TPA: hypothetical protein PKA41_08635 [Verrucomicrobiota bacterium]|nr:hypothetical protein [Verrucomicrobiota bacterium]
MNLPFLQPPPRKKATVFQIVKIDVLADERMDDALDVFATKLISKLLRELFQILKQAPINALVRLNVCAALLPEFSRINCVGPKFRELVSDFIKFNQWI